MSSSTGQAGPSPFGSLALAAIASGVLALLTLLAWPEGIASRELVREDLSQMRNTEWALVRGEPGTAQACLALGRIVQDLLLYVDDSGVSDQPALRAELEEYAVQADALGAGPRAKDEQVAELREHGQRIAGMFESGMTHSIVSASCWRWALFGWCALLAALISVGARRLARAESALEGAIAAPAPSAVAVLASSANAPAGASEALAARLRELEAALAKSETSRTSAESARRIAEEASSRKSAFLASVGHELRTPMTSILGFAEQLLDPGFDPNGRVESIGMIRRNADNLMHLIDDVLDISKIEAGRLQLQSAPCSLFGILSEVRSVMGARAARKGLEFRVEIPRPVPDGIVTDDLRLKQVLLNLVGNAIKFTEHGFVRLSVGCREARAGEARLWFRIEDTGIGLDPKTIERLFVPFSQADETIQQRFGGSGLGLSICAHLVERLGGRIVAEGSPGSGSTFAFDIEAGLTEGCLWRGSEGLDGASPRLWETRYTARKPAQPARVLLAEDGEDNRRLIAHLVRRVGVELTSVENGAEAIEAVHKAREAGQPFDVLLMDMQMPVLDGYSAVRRMRDEGLRTPIIALTANAMTPDRQRCLDVGCDEFCAKPIDFDQFFAALERSLALGRAETPAALPQPRPAPRIEVKDESFTQLVELFVRELGDDLQALRRHLAEGQLEELARLAHQLKGSCGSYGYPELSRRAAELERCVKDLAGHEAIEAALGEFEKCCAGVRSSSSV
ncbi:MAG: response regulator [Planctomycetes bacterium]|nr:response regulator [Planctomycetota bacterium]